MNPDIHLMTNPSWRTDTVTLICQAMRETQNFEALPILADALEEAGYAYVEILAKMRDHSASKIEAIRIVANVFSYESAQAVLWMDEFARDFDCWDDDLPPPYTFGYMIEEGIRSLKDKSMWFGTTEGPNYFHNDSNRREFFKEFSLITGIAVPEELQDQIYFSCSC